MSPAPVTPMKFREPGSATWLDLAAPPDLDAADRDALEKVEKNKRKLHETLLASLQMQNVVVLAGSGSSLAAGGPSMGDLWDLAVGETPNDFAKRVAGLVNYPIDDKNIEEFLSRAEGYLGLRNDTDVETFLHQSKREILERCSVFIDAADLGAHRTFLHRLSRRRVRDHRLKVFTTNYDLCFERAAGELGCVAVDGFSFSAPRRYDPRFFGYDIVRRPATGDDMVNYLEGVFLLHKLHGSVNWARSPDGSIVEDAEPEPKDACLIYPAKGKYQRSFTQPHLESMAQYLAALREPNTCVLIVGFGFNDDHLSEPLLAAATTNPHLRLVVVDPAAEASTAGPNRYWTRLAGLASRGDDVWFVNTGFDGFSQLIPDLKSLTPADNLLRTVQRVARDR